jgi:alpha-L-rhamnosidase
MLKIVEIKVDNRISPFGISTERPSIRWKCESDIPGDGQSAYQITLNEKPFPTVESDEMQWDCPVLLSPYTEYEIAVTVWNRAKETATAVSRFFSGKLTENWSAQWISSGIKNDKTCSLPPETYQKVFSLTALPKTAHLYISALGIYEAVINGQKVSEDFFAPGYTNYKSHVQFQAYEIARFLKQGENTLAVTVANGWFLGRIGNKYNVYGNMRALVAELHLDDTIIGTDESWQISFEGAVRFADFYDGQIIDNTSREPDWQAVHLFTGKAPRLLPHLGTFVRECQVFLPRNSWKSKNGMTYDFGQNFAGTVRLRVKASEHTAITIRHAEILQSGEIFTKNYRSAKATLTFICKEGEQTFFPQFTYTGFRYVEISGDKPIELLSIEGVAFSSEMPTLGKFACSNERINQFQNCVVWNEKSNFMDIPTDCPQRDERLGWTGDIGIFSNTACFNQDTLLFFRKYLYDMRSEQGADGAIPGAVPCTGMYEPRKYPIPLMMWGDAATIIPWNTFLAYGDKAELGNCYEGMKRYVLSEQLYAEKHGRGIRKYLWDKNPFQFGDWCCYGENWPQWMAKGKHLATLWYYNSVNIIIQASKILGIKQDERTFSALAENIQNAFINIYLRPDGSFKNADFESMYVCALYFGIIPAEYRKKVATRLAELVRHYEYKVMTGFPGTPYLLFALADNGYADMAYQVLMNEHCPGWLHMVKHGATTTWERWDAIEENGNFFHGGAHMVSFNHYAYGAVGDFFYRRILGLEPTSPGYKSFEIKPICGTLLWADGALETPYGRIEVAWNKENGKFKLKVRVPFGTTAKIILPDGSEEWIDSGKYEREVSL